MTVQQIEKEILTLSLADRLKLMRVLIDSMDSSNAIDEPKASDKQTNGLMSFAGMFSSGISDTAERAEEILEAEVDPVYGLGSR